MFVVFNLTNSAFGLCKNPSRSWKDSYSANGKCYCASNFDHNISTCKNVEKITVNKITSDEFFDINEKMYTFIYIDGCHDTEFITRDMENSFKFLESGGIMWMDDYRGGKDDAIKNTMDAFLVKYQGKYKLLHKGYQLAIRKL